jgi:Xaa-Pro dipeptidase
MHEQLVTPQETEAALLRSRDNALILFEKMKAQNLVQPGMTERDLNDSLYYWVESELGIKKYWHKRIVRSGRNTLCPYKENPPNLTLQEDDIVFFDFGPVFDNFEADIGRSFVLGNDPIKHKLQSDLEICFQEGKQFFSKNPEISGRDFYHYIETLIETKGWKMSDQWHCGHLIGEFPHEVRLGENPFNYICLDNTRPMRSLDSFGQPRYWILEIHIVNAAKTFGGFYEDILNL